jgi:hypothetical protein
MSSALDASRVQREEVEELAALRQRMEWRDFVAERVIAMTTAGRRQFDALT